MIIFLLHLVASTFMTGLVWFVQLVHYPLMREVYEDNYKHFQLQHMNNTSMIVAPVMLIELGTGLFLSLQLWQGSIAFKLPSFFVANMILLGVIWVSTFFVQIPLHRQLTGGFDQKVHQRLVKTNWLRTIFWSIRVALLLWVSLKLIPNG